MIGPNGSGKTTLLSHIYRVLPTVPGKIWLLGKEVSTLSFRESAQVLTVMRQEKDTVFDYTNMDMVLMGRSPHKHLYEGSVREDVTIARDALACVGMEKEADRLFSTLSGGEKQRVLRARSLAQQVEIFQAVTIKENKC